MTSVRVVLVAGVLILANGCSYMRTVASQTGYTVKNVISPAQRNYKHMLDRETFFVFGKIPYARNLNSEAVAVIAVSDAITDSEVVDVSYMARLDSYYGLNLPDGEYSLLIVSDTNRDGYYKPDEVVGRQDVSLSLEAFPQKIVAGQNIELNVRANTEDINFRIPVVPTAREVESLFYPRGSIRSLDDPAFSSQMGSLGLYAPARFLEALPMMFYALEEDMPHKVPIVFVHGIGGSARDFQDIVAELDRSRFRPWFFHYPSGMDLDQLASMFHSMFLSGEVVPLGEMPLIIVAHSMGGLVTREALNLQTDSERETRAQRLITIASPLGGHPAVRASRRSPIVIPSWTDLHPDSSFVLGLSRKPLPAQTEHHLIHAHNGEYPAESTESTDGVVPLSSQLADPAREQATAIHGFEDTHAGILRNTGVIREVLRIAGEVRPPFPEPHLRELVKGGYDMQLGPGYTALEAYYLRNYGVYMRAMATGVVHPIDSVQNRFVRVANGLASPESELESAWVKFTREYPDQPFSTPRQNDPPGQAP